MLRWLTALLVACSSPQRPGGPHEQTTEYRGGRWFDGTAFVPRTLWVVGDRFATERPAKIDSVVELAGGFVVPAFGEGHNHWLEAPLVDTYIGVHLRQGIFYVKDLSTAPTIHDAIRPKVNTPGSVDYIATHQGFTGPGGHPIEIIDVLAGFGVLPKAWATTHGEGEALFVITSEAELAAAWPKLVATKPAFVKLFLVHSDEYAKRRDDKTLSPKDRGLDPALVPAIVARARAAKLRVTAHTENAHDVHVAIAAGVDDLAHLPFVQAERPESYRIADADVKAAGARKATIATTLDWTTEVPLGDPRLAVLRDNLARLRAAGVTVMVGTDNFRQTAQVETERIRRLDLMTPVELLATWSVTTPRAIFPDRKLGRFETGFEATFLVLGGDPLVDWAQTKNIVRWVKQGRRLEPPAIEMPPLG